MASPVPKKHAAVVDVREEWALSHDDDRSEPEPEGHDEASGTFSIVRMTDTDRPDDFIVGRVERTRTHSRERQFGARNAEDRRAIESVLSAFLFSLPPPEPSRPPPPPPATKTTSRGRGRRAPLTSVDRTILLESVPRRVQGRSSAAFPGSAALLLVRTDGRATVRRILLECEMPMDEGLEIFRDLIATGLVQLF